MIKALGILFGLCALLMLLLIYVATDIDSQAHFDRLIEHLFPIIGFSLVIWMPNDF